MFGFLFNSKKFYPCGMSGFRAVSTVAECVYPQLLLNTVSMVLRCLFTVLWVLITIVTETGNFIFPRKIQIINKGMKLF